MATAKDKNTEAVAEDTTEADAKAKAEAFEEVKAKVENNEDPRGEVEVKEEVKAKADEALADYTKTDSLNTRGDVVVDDEGDVSPVVPYPVPRATRPGYVPARDALLDEENRDDVADNKRAY